MKRLISLILASVMLLAIAPAGVFAAAKPITSVYVTRVISPIIGQPCSTEFIRIVTVPENAVITEGSKAPYIFWYDYTAKTVMSKTDTFAEGHEYGLHAAICPKDGYRFDYDGDRYTGEVLVSRKTAQPAQKRSSEGDLLVRSEPYKPLKAITSITVTGVPEPLAGHPLTADTVKIVTEPADALITEGEGAPVYSWYDDSESGFCEPDEIFAENHLYHICVYLTPKEGYSFPIDYIDNLAGTEYYCGTLTVNGKELSSRPHLSDHQNVLYFNGPAKRAGSYTRVESVTVTNVPEPVATQPCSVEGIEIATDPADSLITEGEGAPYIRWYDETEEKDMQPTDTFITGHKYHIEIDLAHKPGYMFVIGVYDVLIDGESASQIEYHENPGEWSSQATVTVYGQRGIEPLSPAFIYGDVNADGNVNAKDASAMAKKLAGWTIEIDENAADVTCDGKVNGKDLSLMLKYFAGWDVKLGA